VAAKKRARRHLSDTDEYITQNNEGCLMDPMTMSTAYQKMKTLCINLRNEIYTDIQIHNQNILPRYYSFLELSCIYRNYFFPYVAVFLCIFVKLLLLFNGSNMTGLIFSTAL
jgi:hypothetical protein